MDGFWLALLSAVWLGVLTSISPCPLATNIAAISFISKGVTSGSRVLLSGLLYTIGRMVSYIAVSLVLVASLISVPSLSVFLQQQMNKILGPILIVAGMFLLELIPVTFRGFGLSSGFQARLRRGGSWGAGLLGLIFALSFCPISAALFFGSLIPLAVKHRSTLLMPGMFGVGTALPVVCFAFILAFGAEKLSRAYNLLTQVERWGRLLTGVLFILIGIYLCLHHIFGIL